MNFLVSVPALSKALRRLFSDTKAAFTPGELGSIGDLAPLANSSVFAPQCNRLKPVVTELLQIGPVHRVHTA